MAGGTREELAAYAHEAWSGWMRYLFSKCSVKYLEAGGEGWVMDQASAERWTRQMHTPYADLPEGEKESDRAEADKILGIVGLAAGGTAAPAATTKPELTFGGAPWRFADAWCVRAIDGDTQVYRVRIVVELPGETVTVEREFVVRILETDSPERRDHQAWLAEKAFAEHMLFDEADGGGLGPATNLDELVLTGRRDVYGRWLGWAVVDGANLSHELNREFGREAEPLEAQVLRLTGEAA